MKKIDLHGYTLDDALELVEREIGSIRLTGEEADLLVITGRGVIRGELIKYLKLNDIDHNFKWGNDGAIFIRVD
tara:strand:- start:142 stop:363 length:222 start_codon:yes stop_codon:yes gene_type:complete